MELTYFVNLQTKWKIFVAFSEKMNFNNDFVGNFIDRSYQKEKSDG